MSIFIYLKTIPDILSLIQNMQTSTEPTLANVSYICCLHIKRHVN